MIANRNEPAFPAELVSRACLREQISKGNQQPATLYVLKANA
jgi:hypothetical protein